MDLRKIPHVKKSPTPNSFSQTPISLQELLLLSKHEYQWSPGRRDPTLSYAWLIAILMLARLLWFDLLLFDLCQFQKHGSIVSNHAEHAGNIVPGACKTSSPLSFFFRAGRGKLLDVEAASKPRSGTDRSRQNGRFWRTHFMHASRRFMEAPGSARRVLSRLEIADMS